MIPRVHGSSFFEVEVRIPVDVDDGGSLKRLLLTHYWPVHLANLPICNCGYQGALKPSAQGSEVELSRHTVPNHGVAADSNHPGL